MILQNTLREFPFYLLLFSIAVIARMLIFAAERRQRNFQEAPFWLAILSSAVAMMIGSHLITYPLESLHLLVYTNKPAETHGLSAMGGFLLAVPVMFLMKKFYRFGNGFLDAYAFTVPAGMFFQRIGCFLAGCCYGAPTDAIWGVRYESGFPAFKQHLHEGLIMTGDAASLGVHPVQLYEAMGCAIIIVLVFFARQRLRISGSLFLSVALLFAVLRFVMEFFRDGSANAVWVNDAWLMNPTQWIALGFAITFATLMIRRESNAAGRDDQMASSDFTQQALHLVVVAGFALIAWKFLLTPEKIFLLGLAALVTTIWMRERNSRLRLILRPSWGMPIVAFALIGSTAVDDVHYGPSCSEAGPTYDVATATRLNEDSSLVRSVVLDENDKDAIDLPFGLDSTWTKTEWTEGDRKMIRLEKRYRSVREINNEINPYDRIHYHIEASLLEKNSIYYKTRTYADKYHRIVRFPNEPKLTHEDSLALNTYYFEDQDSLRIIDKEKADSIERKLIILTNKLVLEDYRLAMMRALKNSKVEKPWIDSFNVYMDKLSLIGDDSISRMDLDDLSDSTADFLSLVKLPFPEDSIREQFEESTDTISLDLMQLVARSKARFHHSIEVPWEITSTNADSFAARTAYWVVPTSKFTLDDYTMYVEHHEINWWAVAGTVLIVGAGFVVLIRRMKSRPLGMV